MGICSFLKKFFLIFTLIIISWPNAGYSQYYLEFGNNREEKLIINSKLTPINKATNDFGATKFFLTTEDNIQFEATLFDRDSDILIVLGQGFPGSKECMYYYKKVFPNYDLIAFDYRWNNVFSYSANPKTIIHPINRILLDSIKEIEAVLDFAKESGYKKVIALGNCYSNFLFAALAHKFDKIILDSCWLSINAFAESIIEDPIIPFNPQFGGTPECIKTILKTKFVKTPLMFLLNYILPNLSIEEQLKQIENTPVLFIYGQKDLMVSAEHFQKIWKSTKTPNKFVFITPHEHSNNTENPLIYNDVCSRFIETDNIQEFINYFGDRNDKKREI